MARVLKGAPSFTCTHRVHPLTEWTIPALPSIYRPRRGGRLSWPWVAGWLHTEISVRHRELNPDTVAHLSTNRARRRLTSLIEAKALTTRPDHQTKNIIILVLQQQLLLLLTFNVFNSFLNVFLHMWTQDLPAWPTVPAISIRCGILGCSWKEHSGISPIPALIFAGVKTCEIWP